MTCETNFGMETQAPSDIFQRAQETVQSIRLSLPLALQHPKVAIVCGSGLGGLAETIHEQPRIEKPYASLPNFPQSTGKYDIFVG